MNDKSALDPMPRDRFFRAMVLMGGSLALGCGGLSAGDGAGEANSGNSLAGGGVGGGGSSATNAGSPSTGGAGSPSTGGTGSSVAGSDSAASSGSGGVTSPPGGLLDCPPQRWACEPFLECTWSADGIESWIPRNCTCDEAKPLSLADCQRGETFVCRASGFPPDGEAFDGQPPFGCACVATTRYCSAACLAAYPGEGDEFSCTGSTDEAPADVLCGCAVIFLR